MYIPPGCSSLDKVQVEPQIRLGLQGPPKVGKTWAALTFPNPVVLNLDRGLGAHHGRAEVIEVPFYDPAFVDKLISRSKPGGPPNKKDAVLKWLQTEALKLTAEQTLVIDGSTSLEAAHDTEYNLYPWVTDKGKIDQWGIYKSGNAYFSDIGDAVKALHCHVVYICHETADDKGGVRPLLKGQAGDKLGSHYTDWFRCHAFAKPVTAEQKEKAKAYFGCDGATLDSWCSRSSNSAMYLWQTASDDICKCGSSSLVNPPKFIAAHYEVFSQYRRKPTTQTLAGNPTAK